MEAHFSIVPSELFALLTLGSAILLAAIGGSMWGINAPLSVLCGLFAIANGIYGAIAVCSIFLYREVE